MLRPQSTDFCQRTQYQDGRAFFGQHISASSVLPSQLHSQGERSLMDNDMVDDVFSVSKGRLAGS